MNQDNLNKMINEALAIESESAKEAGTLGFMARALVQATMPHKKHLGSEFSRHNGLFTLSILSPAETGIPYGSIPRLLLAWLTTEAVRTKEKQIILGDSLSNFMRKLDIVPTGGRWGTIGRLRDQMQRLFASSVKCIYNNNEAWLVKSIDMIDEASLWWYPKNPNQVTIFESTLTLSERFFNEIINSPIPIDMRALQALSKSPLALDIYCWLTYRMSYLKKNTCIPWEVLELQFGADYKLTRQFRSAFLKQLRSVQLVYPESRVENSEKGLIIKPSSPHIALSCV